MSYANDQDQISTAPLTDVINLIKQADLSDDELETIVSEIRYLRRDAAQRIVDSAAQQLADKISDIESAGLQVSVLDTSLGADENSIYNIDVELNGLRKQDTTYTLVVTRQGFPIVDNKGRMLNVDNHLT